MNKVFFILSLCMTLMIASSCGSKKNATPHTAPPVMIMLPPVTPQEFASVETHWKAIEVFGDDKIKATNSNISFYPQVENFGGNATCNAYSGKLTLNEHGIIRMKEIISTRMACENMVYESKLFDALYKTNRYMLSNETLHLYNGENDKPIASFTFDRKGEAKTD